MKTEHVKLKCWNCGAEVGKQLVSQFEKSIRKDLELELEKKQTELNKQKAEYKQLTQQINKEKEQIQQKSYLKIKEREKVIDDLKKKLDEARTRLDKAFSSQQLAGEVQELELEAILREMYPGDFIEEVKKGKMGADCIQHVRVNDQTIGKIIYESKRTATFSQGWITKLKKDNLVAKADIMVIVTDVMPKDIQGRFAIIDNVWICTLVDIKELSLVLRYGLLKLQAVALAKKHKESNMEMLYKYLTSEEFKNIFESVIIGFKDLNTSHYNEKVRTQKLWKERERLLEQVLEQTISMYTSIKGAGIATLDIQSLENLPIAG